MILRKLNIWCAALVFLCALYLLPHAAFARSMPDLSGSGSITLELSCDGQSVSGGEIDVCLVGNITQNNGDFSFSLSDDFSGSGLSLDIDYDSASELETLACALAAFAAGNDISGITAEAGSDGRITVSGLCPGLYLVIQTQAAEGYEAFSPFLVSVPMYDKTREAYVYDVDASPKVSLSGALEETATGDEVQTGYSSDEDGDESTSSGAGEETSSYSDGNSNVQTGDDSRFMMWFAVFWISALILVISAVKNRRP